ncbi:MAG TPA: PAS domain S-box protein, partial [Anaerolineales bacterium]
QVGILILDAGTGMIQDVNPYLIKMLGYSRKEFIKKKLWEAGAFKDIEASQDVFEALQKNEYIRYEDLPLKAKDGWLIQVEFVSNVYQVGNEKVIQCNIRNITKHNRAEEKIQDLEKFPAENPYPILRIGQDGTLLYINVVGSSQLPDWHLHVGQEVPPILKEVVVKSMNNRTTQAIDLEYGERVYAFFVVPIVASNYTNLYGLDITERKRAEEELHDSEERFKAIASNTPDHILMQDRQLRYIFVANPQLGLTEKDMLGKTDYDFLSKVDADKLTQIKTRVLESGKSMNVETSLISLAGEIEYFDGTYTPKFDSGGQVEGLIGYFRNVTERKKSEAQITYQARLLAQMSDAIIASDEHYRLTAWNLAAEVMYGWRAEEVLGHDGIEIARTEWGSADPEEMRQMIAETGRWYGEVTQARKDGTRIPVEVSTLVLRDDSGQITGYVSVNRDITERKHAEDALRNRESMLQKIFDILPVGLWLADKDGKLLRGNPAGVKIWGAEPKVSPSEYGVFKARRLPSEEELAPDDWALAHTIRDRVTIVDELLEIDAFDGKKKTILNYTAPVLDAQGEVQGAIVVNQDITERKLAEAKLAQSHDQLRALSLYWQAAIEAERTHISHEIHDEFGQSMTALKMDLAWLAARLPEGDEKMDRIRGMNTLVDSSITLMRRIATDLRPALLDDLGLNAALEWQAGQFSKHSGIPCKLNLPKDDLALDPALNTTLFRIFQETLTNITRHAQATRVSASLKQNKQTLVLTLRDNGRGISESELKDPRSLGLLGLRERAAQWGGETTLRGVAGKGTTVTVRIPLPAAPVNGGRP